MKKNEGIKKILYIAQCLHSEDIRRRGLNSSEGGNNDFGEEKMKNPKKRKHSSLEEETELEWKKAKGSDERMKLIESGVKKLRSYDPTRKELSTDQEVVYYRTIAKQEVQNTGLPTLDHLRKRVNNPRFISNATILELSKQIKSELNAQRSNVPSRTEFPRKVGKLSNS